MKKIFLALALVAMVFATGCHKENNGGDGNGGGNNGGGGTPTETTYTVTFDANGGTGEMQNQIFTKGVTQALKANMFTHEGYVFVRWNTKADGSGTNYSDKQTISVSNNMTLYAQWGINCTVTFDANGGEGVMQPQTFIEGVAQMLNANVFTKEKYDFANWNTEPDGTGTAYTDKQEITISESMTLYAQWEVDAPVGAVKGLFSVSYNKKVFFSQGNLQYQASTNTWRFAESQWDFIGSQNPYGTTAGGTVSGSDNTNISSSYSGWIDLFGWGTGNNPTNTSTSSSDYSTFTDWGNNPISNGGNTANQWRTLTIDEWKYLLKTRTTTSGIRYAKATVNGVAGVIIPPDDWSIFYYTLSSTNSTDADFSSNTITSADWTSKFEAYGAVFLPAAGSRGGTSVSGIGARGYYWSSTPNGSASAHDLDFYWRTFDMNYYLRPSGQSVRLVADV